MKITDLALVFIMICLPFLIVNEIQLDRLAYISYRNIEIDHIIDTAVEDGVALMLDVDQQGISINQERALDTFLQTLYLNFGLINDNLSKQRIMSYIPVVAIIDYDGLLLYSYTSYTNNSNEKRIEPIWYPKIYYTYNDNARTYYFTLDDYVKVFDMENQTLIEGRRKDLEAKFNDGIIADDQRFDDIRRRAIIQTIEESVGFHINEHNLYASLFGIEYEFMLPVIEKDDWNNTIDDISMLVFIQGLPIGDHGEFYNGYAIGGARIVKDEKYFLQIGDNCIGYYHRSNCIELIDRKLMLDSQKNCALKGYYPCRLCQP
ncbi:hypothetical protein [Vallitalea okinawensis]|uniref:hypothetical protein n=1 Tax=Vallitalea okinawensis TaxID=2078660 RepID=UPI000CFB5336|nr:hypothetical protein [Vallitalea okinawensis]